MIFLLPRGMMTEFISVRDSYSGRTMTTVTAQANPNLAFIKYSDETHGRVDGEICNPRDD